MTKAESGTGQGQETFAVDGQQIGGPKDFWKRITLDEAPIRGAWTFINQPKQNGGLNGFTFQFPQRSRADIFIEDNGNPRTFTAMGGQGANLDPHLTVTKIDLYLYLNSRKWIKEHEGQWTEWNGDSLEQTNNWQPIGTMPRKIETVPMPTPSEAPTYAWAERAEQNAKHARALKWALAGILVLGGVGWLNSIQKDQNANPIGITNNYLTCGPIEIQKSNYDEVNLTGVMNNYCFEAPAGSIVIVPSNNYDSPVDLDYVSYGRGGYQGPSIIKLNKTTTVYATGAAAATVQYNINGDPNQLLTDDEALLKSQCKNQCNVSIYDYPSN